MKNINSELFTRQKIDEKLTRSILETVKKNDRSKSDAENSEKHSSYSFPLIDGKQIIDGSSDSSIRLSYEEVKNSLQAVDPSLKPEHFGQCSRESISFSSKQLDKLGFHLLPFTAYGVLNGGSATSYIDSKKNTGFYPPLHTIIEKPFKLLSGKSQGRAKGLTPAYLNPDGSPGYSFMELKMRALLILELLAQKHTGSACTIPMFQMTSEFTHKQLLADYASYRESALLKELIKETDHDVTQVRSAKQPLVAALTSKTGDQRDIFTRAYGQEGNLLPLPGGHGQNFLILKDIYRQLHREGKKLAYLVNVDNIGNTPSPRHIALTVLTGCDGSFEFSYKSPIDIKGGVLLSSESGKLTCRDIGVAISKGDVRKAEKNGKPILFNCATGIFNLDYITNNIERIITELPLRVSEQHKDAGTYAQAEQVTWEIIDIMNSPAIIAVNKQDRFLAAKLLAESIMTTQAAAIVPKLISKNPEYKNFCDVSMQLEKGFKNIMQQVYYMKEENGVWKPLSAAEITA